ncbi:MAG: hypothetical protein J5842_04575, partial [Lachnospiraceae bacterium]|nr:hypothetical protein [Lachnospiraceae bacterium]
MKAIKPVFTALLGAMLVFGIPGASAFASAGAGSVLDDAAATATATVNASSAGSIQSSTPTPAASDTSSVTTLKEKKDAAKKEITDYGNIKKVGMTKETTEKIDKAVKKYTDIIGSAKGNTNTKGLSGENSIKDCVSTAKDAIDDLVDAQKDSDSSQDKSQDTQQTGSTSDFIMVGGSWVTPQVSYGQRVNIVLPVVNMSQTPLYNVTVTPVVSNTTTEWPFVLE